MSQMNKMDARSAYEKKTGVSPHDGQNTDVFFVRSALESPEAMKRYDEYIRGHRELLRQLERIAYGR